MGSMGSLERGLPDEMRVKFTGIHPVPSTLEEEAVETQAYAQPEGNAGRPKFAQVGDVSGTDT